MTTENLRREARVDARVPVTVYRGKKALPLETSDISFKGLFVRTTDPPAIRSLVKLRVALVEREFEVHAMAVHVVSGAAEDASDRRIAGVGLQFWGLSGPDRTAWDDFVRRLVHARRGTSRLAPEDASAAPPAEGIPATPSGVRIAVPKREASST